MSASAPKKHQLSKDCGQFPVGSLHTASFCSRCDDRQWNSSEFEKEVSSYGTQSWALPASGEQSKTSHSSVGVFLICLFHFLGKDIIWTLSSFHLFPQLCIFPLDFVSDGRKTQPDCSFVWHQTCLLRWSHKKSFITLAAESQSCLWWKLLGL